MEELMKVPGKIIICMVRGYIHGVMVENMKENTIWIKNMVMVFTTGQMGGNMKVIGLMGSNMEKESICYLTG